MDGDPTDLLRERYPVGTHHIVRAALDYAMTDYLMDQVFATDTTISEVVAAGLRALREKQSKHAQEGINQ